MTEPFTPPDWAGRKPGPKHWADGVRGDDPAARIVHQPTGPGIGDGKVFQFLFGYKAFSPRDQEMMAAELAEIDDDVAVLRKAGYTVVVDRQATRDDLTAAVAGFGGLAAAGIYWSGHGGPDGSLETCDGSVVNFADLDASAVSKSLRLVVLGACYVGAYAPSWRTAFGGFPLVAGWGRPVTLERAVDFLEDGRTADVGLDDLIARWLLTDDPLPAEPAAGDLPAPAVAAGRVGRLEKRFPDVAALLGASYGTHENHLDVQVPLPQGRSQVVQVFLTESTGPFTEGVTLCGMESPVGPTSALVTPHALLSRAAAQGYGRVALVSGSTDVPQIVVQSFVPLKGTSAQQLAAHCYQVAAQADALEFDLYGGNNG